MSSLSADRDLLAGLLGILFDIEDVGDMFLRKVISLSTDGQAFSSGFTTGSIA
jgi:hypothetical protein